MYILFIGVGDIQCSTREEILGSKSGATLTSQSQVCTGWCPRWTPLDLKSTTYFSTRNQSFHIGCSRCAFAARKTTPNKYLFFWQTKNGLITFTAGTQVTGSLQRGTRPLWVNNECAPFIPTATDGLWGWQITLGLQKGGFPLSRFPPWVQGRTSCTSPGSTRQAATVQRFDESAQPRAGHKPQSKRPVHEGPADQGQCRKPPPAPKGFLQTLLLVEVCAREGKHVYCGGLSLALLFLECWESHATTHLPLHPSILSCQLPLPSVSILVWPLPQWEGLQLSWLLS